MCHTSETTPEGQPRFFCFVVMVKMISVGAALLLAISVQLATPTVVKGVGYDITIPPVQFSPPYLETPFDTTLVSHRVPKEARLSCQESIPLYRTAVCDITTYDDCGNLYGRAGNITDWVVTVQNKVTHHYNEHVSPVMFLRPAVARFYFTATELSVYEVVVTRQSISKLPSLLTPLPMRQLVVVHNTVSRCSPATVVNTQQQLQRVIWARSSFTNELPPRGIPGLQGLSKPTSIVVDKAWIYPQPDNVVQTRVRRNPLEPQVLQKITDPLPASDSNYNYCDVVQQG